MRQELTTVTRIRWTSFEQLRAVAQAERRTVPEQLSIIIEDWVAARAAPAVTPSLASPEDGGQAGQPAKGETP